MDWQRLIGAVGAQCRGVDVCDADPQAVRAALQRHRLLVFRDQSLTPEAFAEFAAGLGELDVYPFAEPMKGSPFVVPVVKEAEDETNFGGAWHTDTSYCPEPPAATLLLAMQVPEQGGDTMFADMQGAYDRLSDGFRTTLESLTGLNTASLVHGDGAYTGVVGQSVELKESDVVTRAEHPLVIAHPVTGRPALFFSLIHTAHFTEMTPAESRPILEQLQQLATEPENTTRLHWQPGTLAIWDNRALQHYPLNDYPGERREMRRIILKGDAPSPYHSAR